MGASAGGAPSRSPWRRDFSASGEFATYDQRILQRPRRIVDESRVGRPGLPASCVEKGEFRGPATKTVENLPISGEDKNLAGAVLQVGPSREDATGSVGRVGTHGVYACTNQRSATFHRRIMTTSDWDDCAESDSAERHHARV